MDRKHLVRSLGFAVVVVLAAILVVAGAASAGVTTINFDDISVSVVGAPLSSPYESLGIVFDSPGFLIKSNANPAVTVPTLPNFLDLGIGYSTFASIHFTAPGDTSRPATVDFFAFDNPGLGYVPGQYDGNYNGFTVTARDITGNVVSTATIDPVGPNLARPVFTTTIAAVGIHSVDFQLIPNPYASNALAPLDDFVYGPLTVVPEPTSLATLGLGVMGLLVRRRGRRS